VVSGLGADGIFGSEFNRYIYRINSLPLKLFLKPFGFLHISLLNSNRLKQLLNTELRLHKSFDDPDSIIWTPGCYGSKEWVCSYFKISDYDIIEGRYHTIKLFERRSIHDVISLHSFLGSGSFTASIWSKLSESQSKIVFYPYSDDNLVNYLYTIPWNVKLRNSKNILREIARDIEIPDVIINRAKQSFGISSDKWGEKGGVFEPLVSLCSKAFDVHEIQNLQSSEPEKAMTFWNILNYSLWKRLCIDNEPLSKLLDEFRATHAKY
jgi:asparagine synthetase B (glutamine-hydrolysing)